MTFVPSRPVAAGAHRVRSWSDRVTLSLLIALALVLAFVLSPGGSFRSRLSTRPTPMWKVDDKGLRQLAVHAPAPAYPSTSLAHNITGVVVASVTIDVHGHVRTVTIVDSPDDATALAVRDAVLHYWTFRPLGAPSPAELISGNMMFYFHFVDGRGVVSSPAELQAIRGTQRTSRHANTKAVSRVIDEAEFGRLTDTVTPVVLDIRSRVAHLQHHRDGAVSIPLSELSTRADAELPLSRLIVIDCFAEQQHAGLCGLAVHILASSGFSEVAILNRSSE